MPAVKCAVLAWALLVMACGLISRNGGSSADEEAAGSSQNAAGRGLAEGGGASGVGDAAGTGGLSQAAGSAGSSDGVSEDPLSGDGPVCSGYIQAFRAREAEYVSGATSCVECLGRNADCGIGSQVVTEGQDACFFRHCLCDSSDPSCELNLMAGSCACFGNCLPNPPEPVRRAWFDYMACEVEHCAAVCQ